MRLAKFSKASAELRFSGTGTLTMLGLPADGTLGIMHF